MAARRIALAAVMHGPDALVDRANDGPLGPLLWHSERLRFAGTRFLARYTFRARLRDEPELLDALPPMLDRIDAWIDAGVLNSDALNAADFMIVTSLALLSYRRDLHDEIRSRPGGDMVDRILPASAA
jgi:hypothetical protein